MLQTPCLLASWRPAQTAIQEPARVTAPGLSEIWRNIDEE